MNLIPGATLQNQKYRIQQQLHQSDFGVIYQAQHTYLEQEVVLQTLNQNLRQRQDFDQLRQQFLHKVRSIVQSPDSTEAMPVRVLDCFEEGGLPFVVFARTAGQAPLQLIDWFPLMPHTVNPITAVPGTEIHTTSAATTTMPVDTLVQTPVAVASSPPPASDTLSPAEAAPQPVPVPPQTLQMGKTSLPIASRPRSKAAMPFALIVFSMLGGLLGAGLGLSTRLALTASSQSGPDASEAEPETTPALPSSFLSREQSFPPAQDWPIVETPQFFSSDPLPVEEPVYRGSPTDPIVPDYPMPEPSYQPPVVPSERPAVKAVEPSPPSLPAPLPDAVNPGSAAAENSAAGSLPAVPAPELAAPSEPAPPPLPEVLAPVPPEPEPAPEPPAAAAPPVAPAPANP
jgi:hypothetical protein